MILAGLAYQAPDMMSLNMDFLQDVGLNIGDWMDLLPEGILKEAKDMRVRLPVFSTNPGADVKIGQRERSHRKRFVLRWTGHES